MLGSSEKLLIKLVAFKGFFLSLPIYEVLQTKRQDEKEIDDLNKNKRPVQRDIKKLQ